MSTSHAIEGDSVVAPTRAESLATIIGGSAEIETVQSETLRPVKPVPRRSAPAKGILKPPSKAAPSTAQRVLTSAAAAALRQVPEGTYGTLSSWRASFNRWTNPAGPAPSLSASVGPVASTSTAPPPSDPSLFASIAAPPSLSLKPLKSVRFTMSRLKIVYPINQTGALPPSDEADTRDRVESEFRAQKRDWTGRELLQLYAECCRTREEAGIELIRATLRDAGDGPVRTLDLTDQPIGHHAAQALGDLLSVDFGLRKLVLTGCSLDDEALKPILHALLVSGSLPTLSLANNRRIKSKGWRLVAVFVRKASFLRFLDISDNSIDKRTIDLLNMALGREADSRVLEGRDQDAAQSKRIGFDAPLLRDRGADSESSSQLESLRLENCGLKVPALEALSSGVRTSGVKHVSLRRNRITATGAVALAVMLRDYEALPGMTLPGAVPLINDSPLSSAPPSPSQRRDRILPEISNSVTARQALQPPPKRSAPANGMRRSPSPTKSHEDAEEDAAFGAERRSPLAHRTSFMATSALSTTQETEQRREALHKQLDALPRIGALATLDIRGNDIREGVVYIAQVLKRNRTLRILNLSDNRIDVSGLAAVAEALRLNSVLETLDMSKNPCCGPGLDGINALRTAFAHNTSLVRVFLNGTDLQSEGAICLAEFLPEVRTLLHLDLTENYEIDIAGLMALAVALKMNTTIRCLDLNIPANDPDFARLSQDILTSCIRNTELAQSQSTARGIKQKIAAPILKSAVARALESQQQQQLHGSTGGRRTVEELRNAVRETRELLTDLTEASESQAASMSQQSLLREVTEQASSIRDQVVEAVRSRQMSGQTRADLLKLSTDLSALLDRARHAAQLKQSPFRRPTLEAALARARDATSPVSTPRTSPRPDHLPSPTPVNAQASSPTFSIVDSDEDSGAEDVKQPSPRRNQRKQVDIPGLLITTGDSETSSLTTTDDEKPVSPVDPRLEEADVFRKAKLMESHPDLMIGGAEVDVADPTATGEELREKLLEATVPDELKSPRVKPQEREIERVPDDDFEA